MSYHYDTYEKQIVAIRTLADAVLNGIQHERMLDDKQKAGLQSFLAAVLNVMGEQATAMHQLNFERYSNAA